VLRRSLRELPRELRGTRADGGAALLLVIQGRVYMLNKNEDDKTIRLNHVTQSRTLETPL
jgi:hypothetical protein